MTTGDLFQTPPERPEQAQAPLRAMARATDPATSHMAAADATAAIKGRHKAVLRALTFGAKTDFELAAATNVQQTSIGKRRGECRDKGWVEPDHVNGVPVRRPAPSGSMAQVWRITKLGQAVLDGA